MPFPTPLSVGPVIFLQEGLSYIVPFSSGEGQGYELYRKNPNSATITEVPVNQNLEPGDIVTFSRKGTKVIFLFRKQNGEFTEWVENDSENGVEYFLYDDNDPYNFTNQKLPSALEGVTFWGKISGSFPWGFNPIISRRASIANAFPSTANGINTLINRIPYPNGAPNFTNSSSNRPIFINLTSSQGSPALPVTASRLTTVDQNGDAIAANLESSNQPYQYIRETSYFFAGVFQVTSMSNDPLNPFGGSYQLLSGSYQLLSDNIAQTLGLYFRTSSQSGFSPDDQYVDVTMFHGGPILDLTASMNALHYFEMDFNWDSEAFVGSVRLRVDETEVTSPSYFPIYSLTGLKLGPSSVPIGSGSTTISGNEVTSSADLVEIVIATTTSNPLCLDAVRNYFRTIYNFGIPINYKTPAYLPGQTLWGRMSPDSFVEFGGSITDIYNRLLEGIDPTPFDQGFIMSDEQDPLPNAIVVDTVKPLSGVNFSFGEGTPPSLQSVDDINNYIFEDEYQVFLVLRTNSISTNFSSGSSQENEQIFGDHDQNWGLFLKQSGSFPEIVGIHNAADQILNVITQPISLDQIYLVDFSYSKNVGIRLRVNNQTESIIPEAAELIPTVFDPTKKIWLGMSWNLSANTARNVDTDVLEVAIGNQQLAEPERSLVQKYFMDRYSITGSS